MRFVAPMTRLQGHPVGVGSYLLGKRVIDVVIAGAALAAAVPLLVIAAIGIRLASPGPILYRARRIGRDRRRLDGSPPGNRAAERRRSGYGGREFTMYKFRTMHVRADAGDSITAKDDPRVFPFGAWLRATKIDELPQLFNVIKGEMSLVGPRPEAPDIVRSYYTREDITTLQVLPGLTSLGSLYYYTHCEAALPTESTVEAYVENLLPVKLALDRVYMRHATALYDARIVLRTVGVIVAKACGRRLFEEFPELAEANVNTSPLRRP
jgi:lipopolysaccharide/colanic/teichoic acid biosynthesis glycosyltransferase